MKAYTLGLYEKSMPGTLTWKEKLLEAREAGFDFVEISIDETDEKRDRLNWTKEERLELVKICLLYTSIVKPSLTSIHVPRFEMGAAAMKHMLELIREGEPPVKRKIITLDTEIVERESTKRGIKNSLKYLDW